MWFALHRAGFPASSGAPFSRYARYAGEARWKALYYVLMGIAETHAGNMPERRCGPMSIPGCRANAKPWGALATRTVSREPGFYPVMS